MVEFDISVSVGDTKGSEGGKHAEASDKGGWIHVVSAEAKLGWFSKKTSETTSGSQPDQVSVPVHFSHRP